MSAHHKSDRSLYARAVPKVSPDYLLARREQILAAAAARFARDGFHRTSMQDVIDEAGLSPGAVYRYFRSKDAIIVAISLDAMGLVETAVRAAVDDRLPLPDLIATLPAAFTVPAAADDRMRLAVQAWGEALRNPALAEAMQAGLDGVRDALRERVAAAHPGSDVDPAAVADVLLAILQGFILQHCWNPDLDAASYGRAAGAVVAGLPRADSRHETGA